MKRIIFFLGIIAIISCSKQSTRNENFKEVNDLDIQNIREAYNLGMYFINIARIAQEKATSFEVKELARRSVEAYKQINSDLVNLASEKTISLPKDITDKQKLGIQKLLTEEGISFDKKLVSEIKDTNGNALAVYQQLYIKSENEDISYWALNKLSRLHENLDNALVLHKKMKIK